MFKMSGEKTPFRLGVTGGIGSGKTSVCRVFSVLNVPVFSADREASEIMDNDASLKISLNTIVNRDLYLSGKLDRAALATLIFNDKSLLQKVNELVHPAVFERFRNWAVKQATPYIIMEAAILFESGARQFVDRVATVFAPEDERVQRVIARSRLTREQVQERMKNQISDESRISQSDYLIPNAENDMIIPVVLNIHDDILNYIKTKP